MCIVIDDLGQGEMLAHEIPTPNLDRLAAEGVTVAQGYSSAPMCGPTRAGLLTGRYSQCFGFYTNGTGATKAAYGLPPSEVTLAERLHKDAGYTTGLIGKWHLGYDDFEHPQNQGFDEFSLRLAVVEDALDAWMLHPLQNTCFSLRRAGEAVAGLGRGAAGVRVDPHATGDASGGVARGEVLPVITLAEKLAKLVIAHAAAAARGRMPACSKARTTAREEPGRARRAGSNPSSSARRSVPTTPLSSGSPGLPRSDDPLLGARVKGGPVPDRGQEDQRLDPGRDPRPAAPRERILAAEHGGETLRFPVGKRQRVVGCDRAPLRRPGPAGRVPTQRARAGLHLDEDEPDRGQDEGVHLVHTALVVDELEVRPGAPGLGAMVNLGVWYQAAA